MISENAMVDIFLNSQKGKYPFLLKEVPFLSRCIDAAYINLNNEIVTIEFKLQNWRHAIRQARDHALGADNVYICLPAEKLNEKILRSIRAEYMGLLLYDPEVGIYEHVPAPFNIRQVAEFNNILRNTIKGMAGKGIGH
jgi:hypothetical protein